MLPSFGTSSPAVRPAVLFFPSRAALRAEESQLCTDGLAIPPALAKGGRRR